MKLLLLADKESRYLWDFYKPGCLREYDLMLSCGDLKAEYLTFLVTLGRSPLLYVRGNHDDNYESRPPEGCECIEDRLVTVGAGTDRSCSEGRPEGSLISLPPRWPDVSG